MKSLFEKLTGFLRGDSGMDPRKKLGDKGEKAAARYYTDRGFAILDRNFICPSGELDIVARKENLLVFCEVKTRSSGSFAPPEKSVTQAKRRRIVKLARYYIHQKNLQSLDVRFDVMSIIWEPGKRPDINHIPGAFTP